MAPQEGPPATDPVPSRPFSEGRDCSACRDIYDRDLAQPSSPSQSPSPSREAHGPSASSAAGSAVVGSGMAVREVQIVVEPVCAALLRAAQTPLEPLTAQRRRPVQTMSEPQDGPGRLQRERRAGHLDRPRAGTGLEWTGRSRKTAGNELRLTACRSHAGPCTPCPVGMDGEAGLVAGRLVGSGFLVAVLL